MRNRFKLLAVIIGFFTLFWYPLLFSYIMFFVGRYSMRYKVVKKEEKPKYEKNNPRIQPQDYGTG